MPFINKLDSSSDVTFLTIFISPFVIIDIVTPDPNIFLWIASTVPYAAAVNSNGIKSPLANGLNLFPIKHNPVFSNGPNSLPKNPADCPILCK